MEFKRIADKKRLKFITDVITKNIPIPGKILDFGCGNGIISRSLAAHGYEVTGIDSSEKTIEVARASNTLPNVNFLVVPAGEFTPEPGKYSAIICSEVLEHLHRPAELVVRLHKSLRDDGLLIVTVPNGRGPRELFVTRPVQFISRINIAAQALNGFKRLLGYRGTTVQSSADDLSHIQFFTYTKLNRLAMANNFRIQKLKKSNFIEQVFPFSFLFKYSTVLQRIDCKIADILPKEFASGFMTVWKKY